MKPALLLWCAAMMSLSGGAASWADEACDKLVAALPNLRLASGTDLRVSTIAGKTYKQLFDTCDATDTFAGKPLPGNNRCSTDKNSVKFVKMFNGASGNTLVFVAKAAVDVDGSPASNLGNPNDQTSTSLFFDQGSADKTANAEEVPFVVIPRESKNSKQQKKKKKAIFYNTFFGRDSGAKTGDLAVAVHGNKCSFGVVGDTGPEFRLGEASMKTHAELGNPQCDDNHANEHPCLHVKNGGDGKGIDGGTVTYIVFPGSRPPNLISQTVATVAGEKSRARTAKFIEEFAK
jgi:Fungal chitosanase of glycosyl hydrolase group 75